MALAGSLRRVGAQDATRDPLDSPAATAPATGTTAGDASGEAERVMVNASELDATRNEIAPSLGAVPYAIGPNQIESTRQGENASFNQVLLRPPGVVQDSYGEEHVRGEHGGLTYRLNGVLLPEGLNGFGQDLDTRIIGSVTLIDGTLRGIKAIKARVDCINLFDNDYQLRNGSGLGASRRRSTASAARCWAACRSISRIRASSSAAHPAFDHGHGFLAEKMRADLHVARARRLGHREHGPEGPARFRAADEAPRKSFVRWVTSESPGRRSAAGPRGRARQRKWVTASVPKRRCVFQV